MTATSVITSTLNNAVVCLPQGVESESFPVLQQSLKAGHPAEDQACNNHHFYGGEKMGSSFGSEINAIIDFTHLLMVFSN